jgi:hypothetical protein
MMIEIWKCDKCLCPCYVKLVTHGIDSEFEGSCIRKERNEIPQWRNVDFIKEEKCVTCKFWEAVVYTDGGMSKEGQCRVRSRSHFPYRHMDCWCGEYQRKSF